MKKANLNERLRALKKARAKKGKREPALGVRPREPALGRRRRRGPGAQEEEAAAQERVPRGRQAVLRQGQHDWLCLGAFDLTLHRHHHPSVPSQIARLDVAVDFRHRHRSIYFLIHVKDENVSLNLKQKANRSMPMAAQNREIEMMKVYSS